MTARIAVAVGFLAVLSACGPKPAPATPGAPRFPGYAKPDLPPDLRVTADIRERQEQAWQRLQAGDLGAASRGFSDVLKRCPACYPAEVGLGYVSVAGRQFKQAVPHFDAALAGNARYIPALLGRADAEIGLKDDVRAVGTLEAVAQIDPSRDDVRGRLDLLRLRVIQTAVEAGRRARDAGRLEEAQGTLERALDTSPAAAVLLRELAMVETARGALDNAETHVRRSIQLDPGDAESLAALGAVLEARGRYRDAADAYTKAASIDPRPAWKDKSESLRSKAVAASIPPEYRTIPTAATVTRGQVAAMIGMRLGNVIDRAPKKASAVITDVRGHWAEPWIVPVTQAGVMVVFPNHTFQPGATVRRSDLASIVSQLVTLASHRAGELARWRAARPHFSDLPVSHLSYPAAAAAVSCGAMAALEGERFWPTRPATGAELVAAIARIEQIAGR